MYNLINTVQTMPDGKVLNFYLQVEIMTKTMNYKINS